MAVMLKAIKRSLERDLGKVGHRKNGDYKYTPPNIVARKLNSYTILDVKSTDGTLNTKEGSMMFTGLVKSETSASSYKVFIKFFDVEFSPEQTEEYPHEEQAMHKGKLKKVYRSDINISKCPVALRCSCQDFQHRFAFPLAEVEALVGQPIKYTRKTPPWPIGYPYANSTEKIGLCKHLWSFINELNRTGAVEE